MINEQKNYYNKYLDSCINKNLCEQKEKINKEEDDYISEKTNSNSNEENQNKYLNEINIFSPYFILDQNLSRNLQKKLKNDIQYSNQYFFPNLYQNYSKKDFFNLICDQFGNYLFQVLLEVLNDENLQIFLNLIKDNFYLIGINSFGTRVIQKLIIIIENKEIIYNHFNNILFQSIDKLILTSHGNHIIQKFIEKISYPKNELIYNYILNNFILISTNKFGVCTIQKCLQISPEKIREKILDLFFNNIFILLSKQYGTYIFQYIIENEKLELKIKTIKSILPNLLNICKTKYSSNAIEKCLEYNCKEIHILLLNKIIEKEDNILELITNPFGNYIIQKALFVSDNQTYDFLLKVIGNHFHQIQKLSFGIKLLSKLINNHQKLSIFINQQIIYK